MKPRYVIVSKTVNTAEKGKPAKYEKQIQGTARFHCFSLGHDEYENGPGAIPLAIIEWPDGQVETVYADNIKFVLEAEILREEQIEAHNALDHILTNSTTNVGEAKIRKAIGTGFLPQEVQA